MLKQTWAMTRKELLHIVRTPGNFFVVAFTPLLMLILLTYALAVDITNVPIAVLDYDQTPLSQAYIRQITGCPDLVLAGSASSLEEADYLLTHNDVRAVVIIQSGFGASVQAMDGFPVQVVVDGTEPQSGGFAFRHIWGQTQNFIEGRLHEAAFALGLSPRLLEPPIDLRIRTWYNADLSAVHDVFPALIAVVLGLPAVSVSMAIAREKEHGSLEQLMASPLQKVALLAGKMLPYVIVGVSDVLLSAAIGWLWFGVPVRGSLLLLTLLSIDFFLANLAIGLLISLYMPSQQAAAMLAILIFFFPGFFLSGIFFPLISMPPLARMEAGMLPTTQFVMIARALFLKGVGLEVLWPSAVGLLVGGLLIGAFAVMRFRKKLA